MLARPPLVMVVEDDDDLREVLCELLDAEGYEPIPHSDPSAALRAIANGVVPAAIILDFGLPGIGGVGFLSRLRASDQPWSTCPVLLLTGWQNVEGLGLAVQSIVEKPADPVALATIVRSLVGASSVAQP
jgi:two-component system, OmpR family, phosphate regulon response regulator PhoB